MNLLIDTHLLLWAAAWPDRMPAAAVELMSASANRLLFSVASLWEMTHKASLGRTDFTAEAGGLRRGLIDNGYDELPISGSHVLALAGLPALHKDPFDRILIAQAASERCVLLTADRALAGYGNVVRVV